MTTQPAPSASRAAIRALHRTALAMAAAGLLIGLPATALQVDWMQYFFNPAHTGVNAQETIIHPANVSTLHSLTSATLPSIVDGSPMYLSGVVTAQGLIDVVYVTTKDGHIIALNAANLSTVWSQQAATSPNYTTSSPALDPNRLYVYSYGLDGKIHKYQVGDGTEITTGGWPEVATLKPSVEKSSTGLTIAKAADGNTYLYQGNGGYPGDAGDYQGHVTVVNLGTGAQNVFNSLCSDQTVHFVQSPGSPDCPYVQSAVWSRPGVMFDADTQKIYFATGNGHYDADTTGNEYADSLMAINVDGTGRAGGPLDSYTPTSFQDLQNEDLDLGSTSPVLLPPVPGSNLPHLGIQGGKDQTLRLLNLDNLSGAGGPGHLAGEVQTMSVPQGGQVLTAIVGWTDPVSRQVWAFVGNGSGLAGIKITADGSGNPTMTSMWHNSAGGTSPIMANGMLFYLGNSTITARDPFTGTSLWSNTSIGGVHWESPIVVRGNLYLTDESAKIWVFGPDPAPLQFYTVTPCRILDTRTTQPLQNAVPLNVTLAGQCGIPTDALAVSANVTVVEPSSDGTLVVAPEGVVPGTANVAFALGDTRANNAILSLTGNPVGNVGLTATMTGRTNVLIDVSGYFK